jgi:hypothetical protein
VQPCRGTGWKARLDEAGRRRRVRNNMQIWQRGGI